LSVNQASEDKTARVWNAETGKEITSKVWWRLWDAISGKEIPSPLEHEDRVKSAEFSPDGRRVLTVSGSKAQLWEAATGKNPIVITAHGANLWGAAFSPDGRRVVTTSYDGTARLWDVETSKELGVIARHGSWVSSARMVKIFELTFLLEVTPPAVVRTLACLPPHSHRYSPAIWTITAAGER
jgi:WD40 repeat protein